MNRHAANPGAEAVTADPTHPPFEVGDLFRDYGPAYKKKGSEPFSNAGSEKQ
jgi:hypothetical protein